MNSKLVELRKYSAAAGKIADKIDKSFDFSRDGTQDGANGVWDEEISAFADARTLKSLFFSEDWVFIVIDIVAQKLSSVPLNVVRKTPDGEGGIQTEIQFDHGLMPLLLMPNPWQEYASWMYNYVVEDALSGNGINWFAKRAGHLIVVPTDQVTLKTDSKGRLETYWVSVQSSEGVVSPGSGEAGGLSLPANEIAHTRRPNPASLLWGLSPLTPGRKPILFNRYSQDYLNSFYLKQATPGMAIEMERTVNEELALRQLASFESAYTGRRNQRRTLLLPKGTSAKPLTHTLADQKLVDMLGLNRESLLNLYSVPKHEVGLQESGSLGSEEHRTALKNFWASELIPTGHRISGTLTQFFRRQKMLEPDEFIEFDFESVEALQDDLM
jgi:HK97 family phage portal protein